MAVIWNITRAVDEAEPTVRELEAQGFKARALPCIARSALAWPRVPAGALLFLTSAATLPVPDAARGNAVVALGRVAQLLRASGHQVIAETDGGVVALASRFAEVWERRGSDERPRVLYLCSDLAASEPEHAEAMSRLARFCDATTHAVYRVTPPAALAESLRVLCTECGLVFFSPSGVRNFLEAARGAILPRPAAVVTFGASTARAWSERRPPGWPDAVPHARDLPLSDTLRRLA
jgi:uroporphyrinogen-III synthase